MTFPETPLPVVVEILIDGVWTDITECVYTRGNIDISRGRSNETSKVQVSKCSLQLNNKDGRFSPRNPLSPYYGKIGRNTPIRVRRTEDIITEGFEDASLDITITDGPGTPNWARTESEAHSGTWSFGCEGLDEFDESWVYITVPPGVEVMTFWYRIHEQAFTGKSPIEVSLISTDSVLVAQLFENVSRLNPSWWRAEVIVSGASFVLLKLQNLETGMASGPVDGFIDDVEFSTARFVGEVPAWPQRWDKPGKDVWVPINAAGLLRRLGQGQSPVKSPLSIYMPETDGLVAYWPMEDEAGSTEFASGFGNDPIQLTGSPKAGTADVSGIPGSKPLPVFNGGWTATVPSFTIDEKWQVGTLFRFTDATSVSTARNVLEISLGGSGVAKRILIAAESDSRLRARVFDEDGAELDDDETLDPIPEILFGQWTAVRVQRITAFEGANGDWALILIRGLETGDEATFTLTWTDSGTGVLDRPVAVSSNGNVSSDPRSWAHLYVTTGEFLDSEPLYGDETFGFPGETAGNRLIRIADENDIPMSIVGDPDETTSMGAQPITTALGIFQDCAIADQGILYEPREVLALRYRTRVDLYKQDAALSLDYADGVFSELPEPVDDDQLTRNDITVTRRGGSSLRLQQESGPLSTQAPPDGVGRYDTSLTVGLQSDGQLPNDVSWRLSLGTVDEPRFPQLALPLHVEAFTSDSALTEAAVGLDIGDRITIDNMPTWVSHDLISQIAQGFKEKLSNFLWTITVNGAPYSPYEVAEYEFAEGGTYRYDTAGSSLASDFDSGTDTSMSVDVDILPLWTTDDDETPFDIECGGVRLTVTDISGSSSPQTFTITQTPVNGVEKTIPAGTPVSLWFKAKYAL